jgi:hypothetical protein
MRSTLLPAIFGLAAATTLVATLPARAADILTVQSGTTSLKVDPAALNALKGLGLIFDVPFNTGTPASGYDVGFPILLPNATGRGSSFSFSYDSATGVFNNFSGTIEHTGGLRFTVDTDKLSLLSPLEIGNFSIGYDNGFFLADNLTVGGLPLFDLLPTTPPSLNGNSLTLNVAVRVSSAFNGLLTNAAGSDPGLTGAQIGTAQVSAQAVPEPATMVGLLAGGGLLLAGRQARRK